MRNIFTSLLLAMACFANGAEKFQIPNSYNFSRGVEEWNNDNKEAAMEYFEKEIQDNPKNGYAYYFISLIHGENNEFGKALTFMNVALKHLPKKDYQNRAKAYYTRSNIYCELNDTAKALDDCSLAIKYNPDAIEYYYSRAEIYFENGQYDLADEDYRKIIRIDNGNSLGYMGIGRNHIAQKRWDEAIEEFINALRVDNNNSQAYAFRAECYMGKKDYLAAAHDIIHSLDVEHNDKAYTMTQSCNDTCYKHLVILMDIKAKGTNDDMNWNYYLAVMHQTHKHYQDAIGSYIKSLNNGEFAETYKNIATCYDKLGNYSKAFEYIDLALAMDSTDIEALRRKADFYYYSGNIEKAIATIDECINANPKYFYSYYRKAFYKDNARDVDGAIQCYTYSITLEPRYAYSYLGRGDMYMLKGDKDSAEKDYQKVLELDSTIIESGNCKQYAYQMLGMSDSAETYMQEILEKFPIDDNYFDAACLMSRMGKYDLAIEYLKTAFEKGYRKIRHLENDDDFDSIREMEEYKQLVKKYKALLLEQDSVTEQTDSPIELEATNIPFTKNGNMMTIKCTINNLPLHFIFDTGASVITISDVEANFMLKNGYLRDNDIMGKSQYLIANGSIIDGTILNLRHVNFGGLELENVRATVVHNQKAPLLLGQSVLQKLGKIEIDNKKNMLIITHKKEVTK